MYLGRKCPFNEKPNQVPMKEPYHCNERTCRLQIEGVCAIIGAFYEARLVNLRLSEIEKKLGIKKS